MNQGMWKIPEMKMIQWIESVIRDNNKGKVVTLSGSSVSF